MRTLFLALAVCQISSGVALAQDPRALVRLRVADTGRRLTFSPGGANSKLSFPDT